MEYYCGIDVSLEQSSVCVVDTKGSIVREATVSSDPEALIAWFSELDISFSRIGLEAGPLSQWLYAGLAKAGFAVELIETRHVRDAFKAMPIKTDRKDARGIAQLMRLGWFRPVHCKSLPAQEVRAMLTARKLVQTKLHDVPVCRSAAPKIRHDGPDLRRDAAAGGDVEMSVRGILRGFGLKVGSTTPRTFEGRVRELVEGHPTLTTIADALLAARSVLHREFQRFERQVRSLARRDDRARLLMSTPGVGVLVSLTYASAIDDPGRFKQSKQVGAHFGMTPKRCPACSRIAAKVGPAMPDLRSWTPADRDIQSGEKDARCRISKIGDRGVRTALYEAAHIILTRPVKAGALKSWAQDPARGRLAARAGMKKAKVALARKLAVILHRMLVDGTPFAADKAAMVRG